MVSQYFFCPSGCLHKFVIHFATQHVFARVATMPEKNQPLTYTILHFRLATFGLIIVLQQGNTIQTHKEPSLAFHLPHTAPQPHSTMLQFVWYVPVCIFSCTRYQYYFASRRPPRCVWGLSSQLLACTFSMLDDNPCTVRPHSLQSLSCPPHPVALAATSIRSSLPWLNGSVLATVLKAFNTAMLLFG